MDVIILGSPVTGATQFGTGANVSNTTFSPAPALPAAAGIVSSEPGATGNQTAGSGAATPTAAQVKEAVDKLNASLTANSAGQGVQFAVDPSSKRVVVQVIDTQTGEVLRQVPTEEIIQMGMALGQKLGQVINQQA